VALAAQPRVPRRSTEPVPRPLRRTKSLRPLLPALPGRRQAWGYRLAELRSMLQRNAAFGFGSARARRLLGARGLRRLFVRLHDGRVTTRDDCGRRVGTFPLLAGRSVR
jgi:hypothetical protein